MSDSNNLEYGDDTGDTPRAEVHPSEILGPADGRPTETSAETTPSGRFPTGPSDNDLLVGGGVVVGCIFVTQGVNIRLYGFLNDGGEQHAVFDRFPTHSTECGH